MRDDLDRHIQEQVEKDPAFADLMREARAELDLGLEIARMREKRGLTQRELARRAGMPQPAIARIEKAGRTPTAATLWRLADALDAIIELGPDFSVHLVDTSDEGERVAVMLRWCAVGA
jgi:transcriptional regulator with XRE-family HTH domain